MLAVAPNAQPPGPAPEAPSPPLSGDGAVKDGPGPMGVVQQVQVQAGPAPLPAVAPSTPEAADASQPKDTAVGQGNEGSTMADFAAQEAIRKQAERDVTVSLLGASSMDGKHVSEYEVQQAMMNFQMLVSRSQGPQSICTVEHLVKVVEAVRALSTLMDDRTIEAAAQKQSLMQLVWKHTQRQGLYLEALAKIWSSPEPRCLLTAPELLPHVEALGGWYCQIYHELRAASKQGAVARLLSRSKIQRKFSMFERVLAEHGDVIAEAMGPDAPSALSSPEMDRQLKEAAADIASSIEATSIQDGVQDEAAADVAAPVASGDLISLLSEVATTPTKSTPAAAGPDAIVAAAAPAAAPPSDPFQALAASAPRAASNPMLAQVPEEPAATAPAEGPEATSRRPSSNNPFLAAPDGMAPSRQASGLGSNSAPNNAVVNSTNPFLATPSAPGSTTGSPMKATAPAPSTNPFLAQPTPLYGSQNAAQAYAPQMTGNNYVPQNTGVITTYTYQPTGMSTMGHAGSGPAPALHASFKYPQQASAAAYQYHSVGSTSAPAARSGNPPLPPATRAASTPSNPFMQNPSMNPYAAPAPNSGHSLPPLPPVARTGSAASGSMGVQSASNPFAVSGAGMGAYGQHPAGPFAQGAQQWAAPTPVAM